MLSARKIRVLAEMCPRITFAFLHMTEGDDGQINIRILSIGAQRYGPAWNMLLPFQPEM